jgi:ketosteroid isomerase-like protein
MYHFLAYFRFRSVSLLLALVFGSIFTVHAQKDLKTASQQELDVIKILLKQESAWNRGDINSFVESYKNSPDTLFINSQIERGYDGMVDAYRHAYPTRESMGQLAFSELEVVGIDEKVAICAGKYKLERSKKAGGNAEGLFSVVMEKTENGWKIVADHRT